MQRSIKFRAWDVKENKMLLAVDICHFPARYKRGKILEQFTGLRDKFGKEIYEGDIVMVRSQYETDEPTESPNKVYFRNGAFRCGFHDMILMEDVCTGNNGNWNMEVIGNIHENPELLGER